MQTATQDRTILRYMTREEATKVLAVGVARHMQYDVIRLQSLQAQLLKLELLQRMSAFYIILKMARKQNIHLLNKVPAKLLQRVQKNHH